jgi:aerobic carbon-monoxide dehydrogenase medium subunit
MIPAPFDYELAESVDQALELLSSGRDAQPLAGGHSLLPLMKLRFSRPELLVDLGGVAELRGVRERNGGISIGAMTRHHDLATSALVRDRCAVIADTAAGIGDPQVRHRGTIGGSIAHADPASDFPAVLVALEAELVVRGGGGERVVAAADFFRGVFASALEPGELLTEIRVPAATGTYVKFHRREQDWATVGVAAVRVGDAVHVGLTNMGTTPIRARGVEDALASGAGAEAAAERADGGTDPPSDTTASPDYRRHLARVLVRDALEAIGA